MMKAIVRFHECCIRTVDSERKKSMGQIEQAMGSTIIYKLS
jgi:hypothetical protein